MDYGFIKELKDSLGLPEEMVPKEVCKKCKKGIVWGTKIEKDVYYLRSETNQVIKDCDDCNAKLRDKVYDSARLKATLQLQKYEAEQKEEQEARGRR